METVGDGRAATAPATLRIRLLDGFSLQLEDQALTAVDAPRLQSLLAYLVLHCDARHTRERLAFLFWPDSGGAQARTNLRQALHLLRRALPASERYLESEARAVRWRADAPFRLDVTEFEQQIARASRSDAGGQASDERAALDAAVELYAGDLLPGCYDEWVEPERERLRQAFFKAAERLAELHEAERDYRGAIPWARRLLDDDPVSDGACQRLMRLHALSGDRAGALRVYHGFATALARELGVEPSAATRESYERLLETEGAPAPELAGAASAGIAPLVGRRSEWEALLGAWQRAAARESLLALISGEAGIGKSRLAEELWDWLGRQGVTTAGSRCYAAAGGLAYAPVVELLRSPAIGPGLRRLGDPWLAELARLLPELLEERPELPTPSPLIDDWQRARLLDALSHAVLAGARPLLIVIDDLQWCDRETLGWLHYVLRSKPQAPLLVVATARAEELGREHPARALVRAARASGQAVELELGPLDRADSAALAGCVFGRELDDERREQLYRETEGNPLFVVESVRAGLVDSAPSAPADAATTGRELPLRAHSVIEARLAQLSPAGQELASLAATVGREFTFGVLARASSRSEEQVVDALDELWERRIVRERGVDAYDFSHDKLREAAYLRVGSARRRLLHRRVAQALERLHGHQLDAFGAQLAAHYEHAGWTERAIGFYARSAEVAQRVYANERTIELYTRALELLEREPAGAARDERELALRTALGAPLVAIKGYGAPEVRDVYLRAWELCERLGTPPSPPVLRALAIVNLTRGDLQRAYELGGQLLALGDRDDEPMVRVEGNYVLGVTTFWQGDFAAARDHLRAALAGYQPERARSHLALYSQDPRIICLSRLAYALRFVGGAGEAEEHARDAIRLAEELEHPFSLGYALTFGAWLAIDLGDDPRARVRAERMAALADEQTLGFLQPMGAVLRGWLLAADGRHDEGIGLIREGLETYRRGGSSLYQPQAFALLARACLRAGRFDEGRAAVSEALGLAEQIGQHYLDSELLHLMGELIVAAGGERGDAEARFAAAVEVARRQGSDSLARRAAGSLARMRGVAG